MIDIIYFPWYLFKWFMFVLLSIFLLIFKAALNLTPGIPMISEDHWYGDWWHDAYPRWRPDGPRPDPIQ